jgi:hypothetical protein
VESFLNWKLAGVTMQPGDVISYLEMCSEGGVNLQRDMNYHLHEDISVILVSLRRNAPYKDKVEASGQILVYEGHYVSKTSTSPVPKTVNQPKWFNDSKWIVF